MFADKHIWQQAQALIREHEQDAAFEASQRAKAAADSGDLDALYMWGRVARAILVLQIPIPGDGQWIH